MDWFKSSSSKLLLAITLWFALATHGFSATLIMMEQNACPWCERWHEEIGGIYNKTDEGKIAPLRIVNIHEKWPEDLEGITKGRFTPTFVLIEDGKEIDRLRGYSGDEFFWFLLKEMLDKLPDQSGAQTSN